MDCGFWSICGKTYSENDKKMEQKLRKKATNVKTNPNFNFQMSNISFEMWNDYKSNKTNKKPKTLKGNAEREVKMGRGQFWFPVPALKSYLLGER